jgi:hypothetical protein
MKEKRTGVKTPCQLEDRGFLPEGAYDLLAFK